MNPTVTAATRDQIAHLLDVASNDAIRRFVADFIGDDPDALSSAALRREARLVLVDSILDGVHSPAEAVAIARSIAAGDASVAVVAS